VRLTTAATAALSALVALALVVPHSAGAAANGAITASLVQIGPKAGGGEPSIAIAPDKTIYVSAPGSDGMQFYRSTNGGLAWVKSGSPQASSGDTSVNVDSSGAVYQSNLWGSDAIQDTLQIDIFKSFDKGDTWPQKGSSTLESTNSSGQPFLVDRQWTDAYIPVGLTTDEAQVYEMYHDWGPGQIWVSASSDGGKTFGLPVDVINTPQAEAAGYCNTIPGQLKVVQSGTHAGRIYAVWLAADAANIATGCNETQGAPFHTVWSAHSDDQGATWTDQLVYDGGPFKDGSEIFADLALDNQGNPYVAFSMNLVNNFDVWVEASFDGGTTWNGKSDGTGQPYRVNNDTGSHFFPTIAAGNPGSIDVAYLGTKTLVTQTPYGKPAPGGGSGADWFLYVSQSQNILTGDPTFRSFKLTAQPMHHGDICTLGIACIGALGSNRSLLDFIDIAVGRDGFFHVSYTDDQNYADGGALVSANQNGGAKIGAGGR
jgi:hypothetical protein